MIKKTMRKAVALLLLAVLALSSTGCVSGTVYGKPLDEAEEIDKSQAILYMSYIRDAMAAGSLDEINQLGYHYGQEDAETFEEFWEDWQYYEPIYGQITDFQLQEGYQFGNEMVFVFELTMEKGAMQLSSMYTDDFELVMLFLYETQEGDLEHTQMPEGIVEEDIVVGEGTDYPLAGKITRPANIQEGDQLPAVVLVSGDGANNMNLQPQDSCVYPYRDIAWGLAQQGIVTIRYDKRLYTYADEVTDINAPAEKFTVDWEYGEDALLATQMLRDLSYVNDEQVYYIGHSQGAIVAPRIDEEGGDYAGIVMLSSSPRPWYDVIYDQYINFGLIDNDDDAIYYLVSKLNVERDFIVDGDYLEVEDDKLTQDFLLTRPTAFWRDYLSYDYVGALEASQKPLLILQGEANFQITMDADFAAWQEELGDASYATLKSYEGLNHLFSPSQGCFAGHYKEYDMPGRVSQEVIDDIASWVLTGAVAE